MLWTILIVLLLLWLIGFYGGFVTNSLIHPVARSSRYCSCAEPFPAAKSGIDIETAGTRNSPNSDEVAFAIATACGRSQ
jgi:hypothetical protein